MTKAEQDARALLDLGQSVVERATAAGVPREQRRHEYLGSVEMDAYRKLKFTEVEYLRLKNMKGVSKQLEGRQQEYPIFPPNR